MPPSPGSSFKRQLHELVQLIESDGVEDHARLRDQLLQARELLHDLLAQRFAPSFNGHLASLPHQSLHDKQDLARHASEELRLLGLAIRCPRTGRPASLQADQGGDCAVGRFQVTLIPKDLKRRRTVSFKELIELELMGRPNRREVFAEQWQRSLDRDGADGDPRRRR